MTPRAKRWVCGWLIGGEPKVWGRVKRLPPCFPYPTGERRVSEKTVTRLGVKIQSLQDNVAWVYSEEGRREEDMTWNLDPGWDGNERKGLRKG